MALFETNDAKNGELFLIDSRLTPQSLMFVIYVLEESLHKLSLTQEHPFVSFGSHKFSIINEKLFVDGEHIKDRLFEEKELKLLIVSREQAHTRFFVTDQTKDFVIGSTSAAAINPGNGLSVIIHGEVIILDPGGELLYYQEEKIRERKVRPLVTGSSILTESFLLEKRSEQWKITIFSEEVVIDGQQLLWQPGKPEFSPDFPDYRRSPRLNLEVPTEKFRLQVIEKPAKSRKNSLLRMLLPPLGMVAVTGLTTVLSGRNPIMILGMGSMSLLTAAFTVSQYITDKKEEKLDRIKRQEDYEYYLVDAVGKISKAYDKEKEILDFQQPSPQKLAQLIAGYHSRIYERSHHNKDFLSISLGLGDQTSSLTVDTDVNPKDLSSQAQQIKELVQRYSTQRQVAVPLCLFDQTVGLVGTQEVLSPFVETLLLQVAFFHSYREVNFISLLPKEAYQDTWRAWRLLPHFKIQALNMRGLIYNEKLRDVVLGSFYQLLVKRKQALNEAGREKPQFMPHYIFTIFDDSYLAGHGINELLAEDMSEIGVTVIWCKEDANLLPETVTALVELPNPRFGTLVTDHSVYVAKALQPYPRVKELEGSLRRLSNLNHLEVEKNAVPESLNLLEQYQVTTVEELEIGKRWSEAQPNKTIRSLIGWRGRADFVYWDLHERAHGPHALVGGTTGSGKSEFLTTYLIGLVINFSPEDVGMLIIDWKGGGIASTLDKLPHFMGAITNLDGAGTSRALASIKAELDKRQREFAAYGVNNIGGYMSLYKEREHPKPDVTYPTKPLPHLILVSDEFAELKANVPEFLDELTSVARIGRSLGVHLILATQKPSGVVNDQIEANSKSKIALKMAGEQDSNELLRTPDAAHITNPGRGYLRVGQNEVYELFQSGYAGAPYDPEAASEERVDERIFKINGLGQYELLYDPGEEVVQGKDTRDLPTQLEAVIAEVGRVFKSSALTQPEKPWLPSLSHRLESPKVSLEEARSLCVPLGLLDMPKEQKQRVYYYDLEKQSHTAVFGSPGYGKSTVLHTMVVNLARRNTPEQVQFQLIDFGNNGLLPLKELPHVADLVTLEEKEKLEKMLERIASLLAGRKKAFREVGVANLPQYEAKTASCLPIMIHVLDSYDGLSTNDSRKDSIDTLLMQLLREGASLGVYLVMTAGRAGALRMSMMSNVATKMALYLNDESELAALMGSERVLQADLTGRGQVTVEEPQAIQFFLPAGGANTAEMLECLEREAQALNQSWSGERPEKIPMVPEGLTEKDFEQFIGERQENTLYLGLNNRLAELETFALFEGNSLGIFTDSNRQAQLLIPRLVSQLSGMREQADVVLFDGAGTLEAFSDKVSVYLDRAAISKRSQEVKEALTAAMSDRSAKRIVLINGIAGINEGLTLTQEELTALISGGNKNLQFVFMDSLSKVGHTYGSVTEMVKEHVYQILFGGDLQSQRFIDNLPVERRKVAAMRHILHSVKDENLEQIAMPMEEGK